MNLENLFGELSKSKKIFIYGYGIAGRWLAGNLPGDTVFAGFIDSDHKKAGPTGFGVPVYTPAAAVNEMDQECGLINTVIDIQDVLDVVSRLPIRAVYPLGMYLKNTEVSDYKNNSNESDSFLHYSLEAVRICHEGFYSKDGLFLRSVDLVVTEKCSLKCKDCSNLMQYYENPVNVEYDQLVSDFDELCQQVTHIFEVRLIGGEPFMNKDIYRILEYLYTKDNVSRIVVYSNAMIPIKPEYSSLIKNPKLVFSLTNYGDLAKNTPKVIAQLESLGASYRLHEPEYWTDSGIIENFNRSESEMRKLFEDCCGKNLLTLSNGRLYRCPFSANADRLNAIPLNPKNFVSLSAGPEEIKKYTREIPYIPACNYCKGRSFDAPSIVPAIQTKMPITYIKQLEEKI
jgi:organic radical activating enzyme